MYKLLLAQNNCNILYTTSMVCFGYVIVNTLYKVNNSNNNNDDLRLSLKTHRNSTKLQTHQYHQPLFLYPTYLWAIQPPQHKQNNIHTV